MAWIEITESDLLTVLASPELSGYRAAATAAGQTDPVAPTIDHVVDLVRGYIAACSDNTLGDGATIPEKLLSAALDIIAVRIPQRVGKDPKQVRKDAATQAIRLLEQVAACKFAIEEPTTEDDETHGSATPSISARDREYSRTNEDGI